MSDFLKNLVLRGAGLTETAAARSDYDVVSNPGRSMAFEQPSLEITKTTQTETNRRAEERQEGFAIEKPAPVETNDSKQYHDDKGNHSVPSSSPENIMKDIRNKSQLPHSSRRQSIIRTLYPNVPESSAYEKSDLSTGRNGHDSTQNRLSIATDTVSVIDDHAEDREGQGEEAPINASVARPSIDRGFSYEGDNSGSQADNLRASTNPRSARPKPVETFEESESLAFRPLVSSKWVSPVTSLGIFPQVPSLHPNTESGSGERLIHVHIGTIEVRPLMQEPPRPPAPSRSGPSLEEYLKKRNEGR